MPELKENAAAEAAGAQLLNGLSVDEAISRLNSRGEEYKNMKQDRLAKEEQDAADWIKNNKHRLKLKEPAATYNYVIFDPKNLKITARNGVPLTPVEHDPFAQSEGPEQ